MSDEKVVWWVQRENDQKGPLSGQVPKHIQSTGGMPPLAFVDERWGVTWTSKEEMPFELPTGGAGVMHEGDNVLYFARKEQCLALTRSLKKLKPGIKVYDVYHVVEGQEPILVHSSTNKPEKMGKDRKQVNTNMRKINENVSQHSLKFTDRNTND